MLLDTMATNIVNISQVNIEGLIRDVREEEAMRLLLKQVMENNVMILKLQKQVLELQEVENQKKEERIEKRIEEKRIQ